MADRPIFQRSPRLYPQMPAGELELPAPPPEPHEPTISLLAALWPLVPGLLGGILIYSIARANGVNSVFYLAYAFPLMMVSYLVQIGHHYFQRRKYLHDVQRREERYRETLRQCRAHLQRDREAQQRAQREVDPDPRACLERALGRDSRLWERSPEDGDFLKLRLGLGTLPFAVRVKTPAAAPAVDPDPLVQEAIALAGEFQRVTGVPVCLALPDAVVSGLVGSRTAVLNAARTLALQLATHHSPDEVKLAAVFPEGEAAEWAWLRWVPHVWTDDRNVRLLAADREGARRLCVTLSKVLQRRRREMEQAREADAPVPLPRYVFLVADPALVEQDPLLPLLLREGAGLGALTVVLAERKEELPKECRSFAKVGTGEGQLVQTGPGQSQTAFFPDQVSLEVAEQLARALAPLRVSDAAAPMEIPGQVPLLDLMGLSRVEELDVKARWQEGAPDRSLAVPIGQTVGGKPLVLDLHEHGHGPHGLVAGATGSGKSGLLQTLVVALAATFHPHEVAFVLVDYKGGGMAGAFAGLPHLLGTITNLEGNLARRALAAVKTELKRRQRALAGAGVNHVDEYIALRRQGRSDLAPLPHLILIVDEFAELKEEQPEFIRELISAVRVGRSLGVHLILATQKPAGVVDEQIWSNARFRLCLRVERPDDSMEVLRRPDAASITAAGRCYLQVGNNERFDLFQAGWGGVPYVPGPEGESELPPIAEVSLEGERIRLIRPSRSEPAETGRSQLAALVEHIGQVARQAGIERLTGPWLPPLPDEVVLEQLRPAGAGWDGRGWRPAERWLQPVIGLVDDPENQRQEPLRIDLDREGHLLVYGAPGMGKSTFVQTLVTSLALEHTPADVHLYLIDGGGRSLGGFHALPHVGAVVTADEEERIRRLLRRLTAELDRRKELLGGSGVSTMGAYRRGGWEPLPAVVLVIDDYPAFVSAYAELEEQAAQLAREGGGLGIHLVLTAVSPAFIRHRMSSSITQAITLPLADRTEYPAALGRTNGLEPSQVPGRGLIKGSPPLEFQTALPVAGGTEWERGAALRERFQAMAAAWPGARPEPVRVLPEVLPLQELIPSSGERPAVAGGPAVPIGLEVESLRPFAVDPAESPAFMVAGPAASGKTTLLQTWMLSLAAHLPPEALALWLLDFGSGELAAMQALPHVRACASSADELDAAVQAIADWLHQRPDDGRSAVGFLFIDDYDHFRAEAPEAVREQLEGWVRRERGRGFHLVAAGSADGFQSYDGLSRAIRELQTGFILGTRDHGDLSLLSLRPSYTGSGALLSPGQGYYARRGRFREIKAATPLAEGMTLQRWVDLVRGGWADGHAQDGGPAGGTEGTGRSAAVRCR